MELAAGFLEDHHQAQHGKDQPHQWVTTAVTSDPRIFRVYLPRTGGSIGCPVGGCEGRAVTRTNLRIHFVNHNVQDTVVITDEGNRLHPH